MKLLRKSKEKQFLWNGDKFDTIKSKNINMKICSNENINYELMQHALGPFLQSEWITNTTNLTPWMFMIPLSHVYIINKKHFLPSSVSSDFKQKCFSQGGKVSLATVTSDGVTGLLVQGWSPGSNVRVICETYPSRFLVDNSNWNNQVLPKGR